MLAARMHQWARLAGRSAFSTAEGKPLFDKVLIANRGEIACRVMETCKKLGIRTVAVYSDPDAQAKHVLMADEAVRVGTAASADSYLLGDKIIQACKDTGATAVHPGYGFLSENSAFSEKCAANGIEFIGPNKHAIDNMGDKITSMFIAKDAGVSVAPKYDGEVLTVEHALEVAEDLGYPIIMKASAGGGGKGMRVAWNKEELREGYTLAKNEAMAAFGDDRMLFAKFVCPNDGRHIEIQLIGDKHGNYACFPERECSIQRRNQKVVEESPSVLLSQETRLAMQRQAADLARAVGYHSAGTVEFLADEDQNFYFLEMNTRLQVEHPVTEEVSGEDLVELMLEVSAGKELPARLRDPNLSADKDISSCFSVPFAGWSMESRVYAEDPLRGFLPTIGRLTSYTEPEGHGVRVDSGVYQGAEISMHYDPMISKLVTTAGTVDQESGERLPTGHGDPDKEARGGAIEMMKDALDTYVIRGLKENICFLRAVYDHPRFVSGAITTEFIPDEYPDGFSGITLDAPQERQLLAAAAQMYLHFEERAQSIATNVLPPTHDEYDEDLEIFVGIGDGGKDTAMRAVQCSDSFGMGVFDVGAVEGEPISLDEINWQTHEPLFTAVDAVSGECFAVQMVARLPEGFRLKYHGNTFDVTVRTAAQQRLSGHMIAKVAADTSKMISAPMPGLLISIAVEVGDTIEAGQEVCVLEAMKMQNVLKSEKKGVVKEILGAAGDTVDVDELIVLFE